MKNKRGDCVMVGKKVTAMLLCSVLCLFNMTSVFAMENEGSVEIYEKYRNDIQFKMMQEEYGKDYADTFLSDVENMYIDIPIYVSLLTMILYQEYNIEINSIYDNIINVLYKTLKA